MIICYIIPPWSQNTNSQGLRATRLFSTHPTKLPDLILHLALNNRAILANTQQTDQDGKYPQTQPIYHIISTADSLHVRTYV